MSGSPISSSIGVEALAANRLERFCGAAAFAADEFAVAVELLRQGLAQGRIVVDDQNLCEPPAYPRTRLSCPTGLYSQPAALSSPV